MRQQSFRHRGEKSGGIGGAFLTILAVLVGGFLVYQLILWFRSSSAETEAVAAANADHSVADSAALATADVHSIATLVTADGVHDGTVERSGTSEKPVYHLFATLPILASGFSYEAWLVKDGLADVKSVGNLEVRADGSWVKEFTTKDPKDYPTIVIMIEPNDGNTDPSGNRIAEGRFN